MTIVKDDKDDVFVAEVITSEKIRVAVYGSLRQGMHNHPVLEGAEFLGDFETQPEYTMYSVAESYPALLHSGNTSIQMEVFEVDEDLFGDVNNLEGWVGEDSEYNMYNREEIDTPYGKAYIYTYNCLTKGMFIVEGGDWVKYKKTSNMVNGATC